MTHFDHRIGGGTSRIRNHAVYFNRSVDKVTLLLPLLLLILLILLQPVQPQATTGTTQGWPWRHRLGTMRRDCGVQSAFGKVFGWWRCNVAPTSTFGTGRKRNTCTTGSTGSLITLTTTLQRLQGGSFRTTFHQKKADLRGYDATASAKTSESNTDSEDLMVVATIRDRFQHEVHAIMMGCRVELEEAFCKIEQEVSKSNSPPIITVDSLPTKLAQAPSNTHVTSNENAETTHIPVVIKDLEEVIDDTDTLFDDEHIALKRNVIQRFFGKRISLSQKQKRIKEPLQLQTLNEQRDGCGDVDVGSMELLKVVRDIAPETGLEWNYHQDDDNEVVEGDNAEVILEQVPPSSLSATQHAILAAVRLLVKYAVLALLCLCSVWAGQIVASILWGKRLDTTCSYRVHR